MSRGENMKIKNCCVPRVIRCEEKSSRHINILMHYDDDTLLDKSGKLIKIIKLTGLNFYTKDEQTLDAFKARRNNLLKSFSSEFAFYFWEVRRKVAEYPSGDYYSGFAKDLNDKYKQKLDESLMFHTELYLAVMTKHPEGVFNRTYTALSVLGRVLDKKSRSAYLARRHHELCDVTQNVLSSLADYGSELLSVYEKKGVLFSAPLEFISQLINFDTCAVPLNINNVAQILPRKRLFFNGKAGVIQLRATDGGSKFAAMLSIKAYTPITYQGIFNELATLRCEYVITQSYRCYDRQVAKTKLRDQQSEMLQSKDESLTQADQIDTAFDDTASGEVGYGIHHFSLACYAGSQEELNKHIGEIMSRFADIDIACVREDIACELAFWAQLPGNFSYIARPADISTKNMAAFASLHNYAK